MTRDQIRARLAQLAELRNTRATQVEAIINASLAEGRAQTEDEQATLSEARAEVARMDAEVSTLTALDDELRAAEDAASGPSDPDPQDNGENRDAAAGAARRRGGAIVGREQRTYEPHDLRTSYFKDLAAATYGYGSTDPHEARARLSSHAAEVRVDLPAIEARQAALKGGWVHELRSEGEREPVEIRYEMERRDLTRTDGAGGEFVPPLWMVEQFISLSRASRVVADRCMMMPLPPGTDSINIPRVVTGTAVAPQTADNAAVSETDATTGSVQANVKTVAGQQDLAMQLLDQSPIAFDQVIFADLAEDHAVKTDVQVINGSNASGQVRGILNIASVDTTTYTDASPTAPELYPKLADSANEISTRRFRPPTDIFMHPRRWYWLLAAVDSANRPLVTMTAQGPQNSLMSATNTPGAEGPVGMTPFGPIYIDANIPTTRGGGTEDVIILTRGQEMYLWESAVRMRVLTEVLSGNLSVRFQLYNYIAFMPDRRPESTSLISGTGLAAPLF